MTIDLYRSIASIWGKNFVEPIFKKQTLAHDLDKPETENCKQFMRGTCFGTALKKE